MSESLGQHAIVLGASMAGLLAARVLSEAFERVTVVERDDLRPRDGLRATRRGVSQGGHAHALLARGHQILENDLFPGLTKELEGLGMPTGDVGGNLRWFFNGEQLPQPDLGLLCVSAYRPALENQVRARVNELDNVTFVDRCDIIEPATTPDHERVTGVWIRRREDAAENEKLAADLVMDCTGRGGRTLAWLEGFGYPRPEEERVKIGLTYTTRHYRMPEDQIGDDLAIIPVATPTHPRGAVFSRACGRFQLSLTGILGDSAPVDPEGFSEYSRSLPIPHIFDAISKAEPLDDPVAIRYPASVRRRYEKLDRFPAGMLVMGDAVCSFNPVYAQGMTVSALESLVLRDYLRKGRVPGFREFFRSISRVIDPPWEISATGDLGFPGVESKRTVKVRVINAYMARLQAAAPHDEVVTTAFLRTAGLIDSPQSLLRPGTSIRVLRKSRRGSTIIVPQDRDGTASPVVQQASSKYSYQFRANSEE
jgi:2-polyprenyl-6-methoxyphenol hydroxylase-like FAD-dependent oxidoreductase